MGEDFTLGTREGFVGVDLWASEWGRLLQRIGRPPWPRGWFTVAVVLRLWEGRLCETMRDRCGSVVHRGRGRSVSALRVGSYHGRKGWRRVVFKLHRLFSNFTVTGSSVREPEEHNRKLLITHCSTARQHGLSSAAQSNNTLWQRPCSSLQQPL